jgi:Protein of unknown function, DUF481
MDTRPITFASIFVFLAVPILGREKSDVIVLANGDRITGEIKDLGFGVLKISVNYVDGDLSVQWSQVVRIESSQLFLVEMQDGSVYTGTLTTAESKPGGPTTFRILEFDSGATLIADRSLIVKIEQTSKSFLKRLSGGLSLGVVYSKGNAATQYTFGSDIEYLRERWGMEGTYNSNLSANSGSSTSTRNQTYLSAYRLMRRKNYFYSGFGGFLQSSVQGINLQTTLGGGIGRYFKNTNRVRFSVIGGVAWQSAAYNPSAVAIPRQQIYGGVVITDLNVFLFKRTNLKATALVAPAFSDLGRVHTMTNVSYYLKLFHTIDWDLSFYGNWDTRPPAHLAASDYGYSSGLKWTFGAK